MRQFIVDSWNSVMNADYNPLKKIPDLQVRHLVLQLLAWMWCVAFSLYFGSWLLLGITFVSHLIIILAIVVTVATFTITERTYNFKGGYHSADRQREYVIYRDKNGKPYKVKLPPNDPGGEHD